MYNVDIFLKFEVQWSQTILNSQYKSSLQYNDSPPPPNVIDSRFWYAFSLFLRKFHSVQPFNSNFCEPGRARFAEKKMDFHLRLSVKRILFYFQSNSDRFRTRLGAVHDERAEWTCSCHGLCSKTWDPYGGGNFVSFNMEKAYQNRE